MTPQRFFCYKCFVGSFLNHCDKNRCTFILLFSHIAMCYPHIHFNAFLMKTKLFRTLLIKLEPNCYIFCGKVCTNNTFCHKWKIFLMFFTKPNTENNWGGRTTKIIYPHSNVSVYTILFTFKSWYFSCIPIWNI